MTDIIKPKKLAFFCDEAGKDTDRFLAVGGLIVSDERSHLIHANIKWLIDQNDINTEIKWNKTKKGNFRKHKALVDYFFLCIERGWISFHVLFVDFQRFDHELKAGGNKAESLKRMYSQIILHRFGKHFGNDHDLYVFPDQAKELVGLNDMKERLNDNLSRKHKIHTDPIKAIEFRDSKKSLFLQFNDIVLGGLCYQRNWRHESVGAGQYKANLAGYIQGKSGIDDLTASTPRHKMNFSVWNFDSKNLRGS